MLPLSVLKMHIDIWSWVLIASDPDLCILFTYIIGNTAFPLPFHTRDDKELRGLPSLLNNGLDERIQISSNDTWT